MNKVHSPKKTFKQEFLELLRFTLIVLAIVIPIRVFIAQPFVVNGESMVPTFENGDYIIIDQVSYRATTPKRGEVIVFHNPTKNTQFLIKRVIGLPGETIEISGSQITIKKDDKVTQLDEDYINGDFSSYGSWKLEDNEYFTLGDNRQKSLDSRSWGVLSGDLIVGKTFLRLFPITHFAVHPGQESSKDIEIILE
jgi:signal peptidase I